MSEKVDFVFSGYLKLSAVEKEEMQRRIRDYERSDPYQRLQIERGSARQLNEFSLGPKAHACTCCGRSS